MMLIITFMADLSIAQRVQIVKDLDGTIVHQCRAAGAQEICVVEMDDDKIQTLAGRSGVANVTRDSTIRLQELGIDAVFAKDYESSWGVRRVNAPQVHATGNKGGGKRIAVLDTGSWANHPDLDRAGEFHAISPGTPVTDVHGHGTHTHGIIGAQINDVGAAGVAPEAAIFPVVVMSDSGSGAWSTVVVAVDWCIQNNMEILSCSFGGSSHPGSELETIMQVAADKGIQIVCAAGNGNGGRTLWPAAFDSCISVASTDEDDTPSSYNSVGPQNEVAGPGRGIFSTYKNGAYATLSGTSMAAPFVAAIFALMLTAGITNPREKIKDAVLDLDPAGRDEVTGWGLLLADLAVDAPENPIFPRSVVFDSSRSSDPDGSIIGYWFLTGEGAKTGDAAIIEHTYSQDGIYKVRAAVRDNDMVWSPIVDRTIEIKGNPAENVPPVCRLEVRAK